MSWVSAGLAKIGISRNTQNGIISAIPVVGSALVSAPAQNVDGAVNAAFATFLKGITPTSPVPTPTPAPQTALQKYKTPLIIGAVGAAALGVGVLILRKGD